MSDLTIKSINIFKIHKRFEQKFLSDLTEICICQDITTHLITHCKVSTPAIIKLRSELRFDQHNLVLSKESLVLTRIIIMFSNETTLPQQSVFNYEIYLYFPEHKLAIKVDEKRRKGRSNDYEIKRQKVIEKELDWKFIWINPGENDFDMNIRTNKIHNHITESTKKSLTGNISKRLLERKFKSDHSIKYKALEYVVNKTL